MYCELQVAAPSRIPKKTFPIRQKTATALPRTREDKRNQEKKKTPTEQTQVKISASGITFFP